MIRLIIHQQNKHETRKLLGRLNKDRIFVNSCCCCFAVGIMQIQFQTGVTGKDMHVPAIEANSPPQQQHKYALHLQNLQNLLKIII